MGKKQRCVYSLCNSSGEDCDENVFFIKFPRPKKDLAKCQLWIKACGRYDNLLKKIEKRTEYICSLHFEGGNGPTKENPDPVPFEETEDSLNLMASYNSSSNFYQLLTKISTRAQKI